MEQNQKTVESRTAGAECIFNAEGLSSLIRAAAVEFGSGVEGREGWKVFLLALCGVQAADMAMLRWRDVNVDRRGYQQSVEAVKLLWALRAGPREFVVDSPEGGERAIFNKVRGWLLGQGVGGHSPLRTVRAAGLQAHYDYELRRGLCQGVAAAGRSLSGRGSRRGRTAAIGRGGASGSEPGSLWAVQSGVEPNQDQCA